MLLTTLSILFFTLASIYFIHRINTANNNICQHVEHNLPQHWQDFVSDGAQIGDNKLWPKHIACASVKTGELSSIEDDYLNKQKKYLRKDTSLLSLSVILGFTTAGLSIPLI